MHAGLLLSAGLAGAAGLGIETLLLESAGLALGYGRAAAFGLAAFVCGWALGAWLGTRPRRLRPALVLSGAAVLGAGSLALHLLLAGVPTWAGIGALVLAALPQGALLPLLVAARERVSRASGSIQALWVANLAGAVAGAWVFGEWIVFAHGREAAVIAAGVCGALAGALAAGVSPRRVPESDGTTAAGAGGGAALSPSTAALAIGAATAWMVGLEWVALRLGVLWLGGMQQTLAALLGASLLSLALGAAVLPALLPRGRAGVAWLFGLAPLASGWLILCAPALSAVEGSPPLLFALVLVGPALLPFGAAVPVIFRAASAGRPAEGRRVGRLLLHEAWGAALGGALIQASALPAIGLCMVLALFSWVGLGAAAALGRAGILPGLACLALSAIAFVAPDPARASPPLSNPAFSLLAFEEDTDFAVSVIDDGLLGERTLLTDGFRAAGSGRDYRYMRALGHLPVLLHPAPARVCVLALGTGTTLGAVSLHPEVEQIDVLELSQAVVRQASFFSGVNRGSLEDPRVTVVVGDGRRALAARAASYDVITLEPLLPDSPFAVYLYTEEFYAAALDALRPGGLVCQWVPPHALEPASFNAVVDAFCRSFPHATVWLFDTQVALVGGERVPGPQRGRFPSAGALAQALAELGLDGAARLAGHWVGDGADFPAAPRPLTDEDPWIIRSPRRAGAALLGDLPVNLATLAALESPPPWEGLGEPARARWEGLRALAHARAAHAADEARARGADLAILEGLAPGRALDRARAALGGEDPALSHFIDELAFLRSLRRGVSLLSAADPLAALGPLTTAAELRPERADVHLYLAAALQAQGAESAAAAAWSAARQRCPRVLETPAGARALALGLRAQ